MRHLIETFKHKLSIFKRPEIDSFQASKSDIENMYEQDQLLDSDDEEGKAEDVEISNLLQIKIHLSETFGSYLNKRCPQISAASKKLSFE